MRRWPRDGRRTARSRTPPLGRRSGLGFVLGQPQVPLQLEVLPLGIADHALTVPPELRVVRRKEHQPGEDAPAVEPAPQEGEDAPPATMPESYSDDVVERTREIGVRMATGARGRDILLQFNIEAVVVCCIGGLLGIVFGVAIAQGLGYLGQGAIFTPMPSVLAFSCALITGVVFGYLPARKASRLDPVTALAAE